MINLPFRRNIAVTYRIAVSPAALSRLKEKWRLWGQSMHAKIERKPESICWIALADAASFGGPRSVLQALDRRY